MKFFWRKFCTISSIRYNILRHGVSDVRELKMFKIHANVQSAFYFESYFSPFLKEKLRVGFRQPLYVVYRSLPRD